MPLWASLGWQVCGVGSRYRRLSLIGLRSGSCWHVKLSPRCAEHGLNILFHFSAHVRRLLVQWWDLYVVRFFFVFFVFLQQMNI